MNFSDNKFLRTIFSIAFLIGALGISACDSDGPMEEAGEEIDEAAEEVEDSAEDTADEIDD